MSNVMEIRPASLEQFQQSPGGAWLQVEATVGDIAKKVRDIDTGSMEVTLHLSHNVVSGVWAVFQRWPSGDEELLQTATECDDRLVEEVRRIVHRKLNGRSGDLIKELHGAREKDERDHEQATADRLDHVGEKTAHAVKAHLGVKDKAFIGKGLILP